MEKGILTPEQEKFLAEKLDEAIKLKGILEVIDGMVFKAIITFVDNSYVDDLKVEIKVKLQELVAAVISEDYDTAETIAADIINALVDIPGLDEEAEGLLFKGAIQIIVAAILKFIESRKSEPVILKLYR